MQYLNSNFVKAIEKNGNYQAAILKIQKEVDAFAKDFNDDPKKTSE